MVCLLGGGIGWLIGEFKPEQIAEMETVWFCDFVEFGLLEKGERRNE